jgi:hypothetical protein
MDLFSCPGKDPLYELLRTSTHPVNEQGRRCCELLWADFHSVAEPRFVESFREDVFARFWEMYLGVTMLKRGHELICTGHGPDLGFDFEGQRIWIEAVTLTPGQDGAPDRVPEFAASGTFSYSPERQMLLRYLNAIDEKLRRKYARWVEQEIVHPQDAYVIAINGSNIDMDLLDSFPPRLAQAALPLGSAYAIFSGASETTTAETDWGLNPQVAIKKLSGSDVPTAVFLSDEGKAIGALLRSSARPWAAPADYGSDFEFIRNPWAFSPLPATLILPGHEYVVTLEGDHARINGLRI